MSGPGYQWICHKCRASNDANADSCAACNYPAVASGMQINPPKSTKSKANLDDPWTMAIYFPKGLIAAFIVFVTPLWALGMLIHGHILPALAIVVTTAVLAYWCFVFVRSGDDGW